MPDCIWGKDQLWTQKVLEKGIYKAIRTQAPLRVVEIGFESSSYDSSRARYEGRKVSIISQL